MGGLLKRSKLGLDKEQGMIHLEISITEGRSQYITCKLQNCTEGNKGKPFPGFIIPNSLVVQDEYVFIQVPIGIQSVHYVSYKRNAFYPMKLPKYTVPKDLQIISTDDNQVVAAIQDWHQNDSYHLYMSESRGLFFTLMLESVVSSGGPEGNIMIDLYEITRKLQHLQMTPLMERTTVLHPAVMKQRKKGRLSVVFRQGGTWEGSAKLKLQRLTTPERRSSSEETESSAERPMGIEHSQETPQIEVIKGSGVFCQAEAWKAARLATSATAMVRNLLLGTFDLETLLKSNLKGPKKTIRALALERKLKYNKEVAKAQENELQRKIAHLGIEMEGYKATLLTKDQQVASLQKELKKSYATIREWEEFYKKSFPAKITPENAEFYEWKLQQMKEKRIIDDQNHNNRVLADLEKYNENQDKLKKIIEDLTKKLDASQADLDVTCSRERDTQMSLNKAMRKIQEYEKERAIREQILKPGGCRLLRGTNWSKLKEQGPHFITVHTQTCAVVRWFRYVTLLLWQQ
uniref:Sortilin N-terminal domain-containing protein n=1 Tax=Knipowitschia caucasica TaxID=637954 RepID=A0AAV2JIY1_KNICA